MMETAVIFAVLVALGSLWAGSVIGRRKGRPAAGFFWPFFLGPIGVLIVAVLPDARAQERTFDALEREDWQRLKADLQQARRAAADQAQEDGTFIPESMRAPKLPPRGNFELRKPSH